MIMMLAPSVVGFLNARVLFLQINTYVIIFVIRKLKQSSGGTGRVTVESRGRTSVYH